MLPQLHQGSSHFEIRTFNIILNHKSKPQLLEDPDESLSLILQLDHVLTGLFFSLLVASISLFLTTSFGSFWLLTDLLPVSRSRLAGGWPAEGDRLHRIGGKKGIVLPDTCGERCLPAGVLTFVASFTPGLCIQKDFRVMHYPWWKLLGNGGGRLWFSESSKLKAVPPLLLPAHTRLVSTLRLTWGYNFKLSVLLICFPLCNIYIKKKQLASLYQDQAG